MEGLFKIQRIRAHLYDLFMLPANRFGLLKWRKWATAIHDGKILEIGIGTGLNIEHYKPGDNVYAVEPDLQMLKRAAVRREKLKAKTHLIRARAEFLPFPDAAFDAALGTLVLCTVNDLNLSLRELYRVLKPEGTIRLFEHVRMEKGPGAPLQDFLTPAWKRIAGGCHMNRNTLAAVENAGFKITRVRSMMGGIFVAADGLKPVSKAAVLPASNHDSLQRPVS
jgi:ubiquinone/menaquinone biosynthesis C-methylase UbiE